MSGQSRLQSKPANLSNVVPFCEFPYYCHATAIEGTCEIRPFDYGHLKPCSDSLRQVSKNSNNISTMTSRQRCFIANKTVQLKVAFYDLAFLIISFSSSAIIAPNYQLFPAFISMSLISYM